MNYKKIYSNLIQSRLILNRSKQNGYYEKHHIIPKCIGGCDDQNNLVLLTPREHFLAHYLLWKIHKIRKLRDAILYFKGKHLEFSNSRLYEIARIEHIKEMKNNNPSLFLSTEIKERKKQKLRNYIKTEQHRKNISNAAKGKQRRLGAILEKESKEKISNSLKNYFKDNPVSDETKEKLRVASTGKKHSAESLLKQKNKALIRPKFKCPHCDKIYDAGNLKQHMTKLGYTFQEYENAKSKVFDNE